MFSNFAGFNDKLSDQIVFAFMLIGIPLLMLGVVVWVIFKRNSKSLLINKFILILVVVILLIGGLFYLFD